MVNLAKLMLRCKVAEKICPNVYGGSLTAQRKKDGGISPTAVGNTLKRLAAKIIGNREQFTMDNDG